MNPSDDEDDLREEATEREKRKARRRLLRAAAEVQRLCPEDEENDENEKENASRAAATAAAKAKSRAAATEAKRLREGNRYLRQELVAAQRLMTGYHAQLMTGGGVRLVDASSSTTTRAGGARPSGGSLLSFSPEKIGAFPWEASLRASSPAAARGSPVSIRADAVSLNETRDVVVEGGVRTANRAAAKKLAAGRAAIPGVGYEYLARADVGSDRLTDEVSELRKLVRKMADRDEKKDAGTSGA